MGYSSMLWILHMPASMTLGNVFAMTLVAVFTQVPVFLASKSRQI